MHYKVSLELWTVLLSLIFTLPKYEMEICMTLYHSVWPELCRS